MISPVARLAAWLSFEVLLIADERQAAGEEYAFADVVTLSGASMENVARCLRWLYRNDLIQIADGILPDGPMRLTSDALARMGIYLGGALSIFGAGDAAADPID